MTKACKDLTVSLAALVYLDKDVAEDITLKLTAYCEEIIEPLDWLRAELAQRGIDTSEKPADFVREVIAVLDKSKT